MADIYENPAVPRGEMYQRAAGARRGGADGDGRTRGLRNPWALLWWAALAAVLAAAAVLAVMR